MGSTSGTTGRSRWARAFGVFLTVFVVLSIPAAAQAQTSLGTVTTNSNGSFDITVTIPAGTTPGTYDVAATGTAPSSTPYPPSSAPAISLSPTVVRAGQQVRVIGSGFSPNTTVTLRLEFVSSFTIAQTQTQTVTVRARLVVVGPTAIIPPQIIPIPIPIAQQVPVPVGVPIPIPIQSGDRGGPIIVTNNNSSSSSSSAAASAGGGVVTVPTQPGTTPKTLARTGVEGLPLLAAAMASMVLGWLMLGADRRRQAAALSR